MLKYCSVKIMQNEAISLAAGSCRGVISSFQYKAFVYVSDWVGLTETQRAEHPKLFADEHQSLVIPQQRRPSLEHKEWDIQKAHPVKTQVREARKTACTCQPTLLLHPLLRQGYPQPPINICINICTQTWQSFNVQQGPPLSAFTNAWSFFK